MPRKVRQLVADLAAAGFVNRGSKGSHRNFAHPRGVRVTLSGGLRDDAKTYEESGQLLRQGPPQGLIQSWLVAQSMGTAAHRRIRVSSLTRRKPCTKAVATMSWSAGSL